MNTQTLPRRRTFRLPSYAIDSFARAFEDRMVIPDDAGVKWMISDIMYGQDIGRASLMELLEVN